MSTLKLIWPKPGQKHVYPLFIPFGGCPVRCVFCSQEQQTGQSAHWSAVREQFRQAESFLSQRARAGLPPAELAFYGGTFTGLEKTKLAACLDFAQKARDCGLISGFRCSTRPDFVNPETVTILRKSGCILVELGIQSFAAKALAASQRGYSPEQAIQACATIKNCGLQLGIQLLPGMPGSSHADFLRDVQLSLAAGCDCLRFYPCLVLRNTLLARMWSHGQFKPWSLARTICGLARGWNMALARNVPVIRMGLAPQSQLEILAGPTHPALGSRVMGQALYLLALQLVHGEPDVKIRIRAPERCHGFFWGWKGELKNKWQRLGLKEVTFWQKSELLITCV